MASVCASIRQFFSWLLVSLSTVQIFFFRFFSILFYFSDNTTKIKFHSKSNRKESNNEKLLEKKEAYLL